MQFLAITRVEGWRIFKKARKDFLRSWAMAKNRRQTIYPNVSEIFMSFQAHLRDMKLIAAIFQSGGTNLHEIFVVRIRSAFADEPTAPKPLSCWPTHKGFLSSVTFPSNSASGDLDIRAFRCTSLINPNCIPRGRVALRERGYPWDRARDTLDFLIWRGRRRFSGGVRKALRDLGANATFGSFGAFSPNSRTLTGFDGWRMTFKHLRVRDLLPTAKFAGQSTRKFQTLLTSITATHLIGSWVARSACARGAQWALR